MEEYSIEHYLSEHPEDELLDQEELDSLYRQWVDKEIKERYADAMYDAWLARRD